MKILYLIVGIILLIVFVFLRWGRGSAKILKTPLQKVMFFLPSWFMPLLWHAYLNGRVCRLLAKITALMTYTREIMHVDKYNVIYNHKLLILTGQVMISKKIHAFRKNASSCELQKYTGGNGGCCR